MEIRVATDLDGSFGHRTIPEAPQKPVMCISGRTYNEYDEKAKQIACQMPLYIRHIGAYGDRRAAAEFKATMIKLMKITHFIEDDLFQSQIIHKLCPGVVLCIAQP